MIDQHLSGIVLVLRCMSVFMLIIVIREQLRAFSAESTLGALKKLLLTLGVTLLLANIIPIINNYQRYMGTQSSAINRASYFTGGIATFVASVLLYLVYKFKIKE